MKNIKFDHIFRYLDKQGNIIRDVKCTAKETLASAESVLKDFGAYEVIPVLPMKKE